jgi:sterol desaturase/sphingolipid hydroxylase (fatty acid hydroxylase superfamily)
MTDMSATSMNRILIGYIIRLSRTRVNYWAEFVIDGLLGTWLIATGLHMHSVPIASVVGILLSGVLVFSFIEYLFHRWLFHGPISVFSDAHAAHHRNPLGYDALPFFIPPLVLMGLIVVLAVFLPPAYTCLLSGAIALSYVGYGLSHFFIHHTRLRLRFARNWAARHHIHHFHPDRNFGVTTPLWDMILKTRYQPDWRQPRAARVPALPGQNPDGVAREKNASTGGQE